MSVPILKTSRLVLRPFRPEDEPAIHAFGSDSEVVRHMVWGPNSPEDTRHYLMQRLSIQKQADTGSYQFAITVAGGGKPIGSCGLEIENLELGEALFGYVLARSAWGKGYGTEAARRLLRFGFEDLRMHRIFATCRPENIRSQRVLEKLGMRLEAHFREHIRVRGEWRDSLLYAMLAEEWRKAPGSTVIFDMDGVIVNSEPVYYASNRAVFEKLGLSIESVGYDRFVGISAEKMWETVKAEHGLVQPIAELVEMEEAGMLEGLARAELQPMPGLLDLMDRLQAAGLPFALASSSPRQVIRTVLEKLGLADRFLSVVSGEDVANGKPAPDIFLLAAGKLGLPPENCLVIEDSANGVRGAKAAGMVCVGFRNPHSGNQDLSPADAIVARFDDDAIDRILRLVPLLS